MAEITSMFRTSEAEARYFAAYDATLALWPVEVDSFNLPTSYGPTHVHVCGPESAPPLLLIPGAAISSTMWYSNIAALSQAHRVYVPDVIGDMGKSIRTAPVMGVPEYARWMVELADSLELDNTDVVGISAGGCHALLLTLAAQERVNKLVLIAPAGITKQGKFYLLRMMGVFLPLVSLETKQKWFLGTTSKLAQPAIRQMMTPNDFRYSIFLPPLFTDEELQQINCPTLLVVGKQEVIFNPSALLARAEELIPNLQTVLLPDAGHALNFDQPDVVNQHILGFLSP